MKVTDYIIEFLISKSITDIFGYPGGVICHFIDSASKYKKFISAHAMYHEQSAAFAACGYAQESGKPGVAYATSGPGATNLITGIANAYFDSIPTLFFTGQVDTYSLKGALPIRQRGFQETDIVSIAEKITKYAVQVTSPQDIVYEMEKAYCMATTGNPGPVLIDLPADVQRADIDMRLCKHFEIIEHNNLQNVERAVERIQEELKVSNSPCLLIGNGVKQSGKIDDICQLVNILNIPAVFSMPAFDILPHTNKFNFGFIGANGHRYGNFVLGKSDLIISVGSRLDLKQVGTNREAFCSGARIVRIDIDPDAFQYPVHKDEIQLCVDLKKLLPQLLKTEFNLDKSKIISWYQSCDNVRKALLGYDDADYTKLVNQFGEMIPDDVVITGDVGQSEVWLAQQLHVKPKQNVHFSAGLGAMGYSLPSAVGAYYVNKRPVYSFSGDGGIQMNVQELQFIARENIPICVIIMNNKSLGMIRGFQENNFAGNYEQTIEGRGYAIPDFSKLAYAYDLPYYSWDKNSGFDKMEIKLPCIIELTFPEITHLVPNFGQNGLIQDQKPYLERTIFDELMKL